MTLLLSYKLTHPRGDPLPFDAWFRRVPDAAVHGLDIAFDRDDGRATYVAEAKREGTIAPLVEDVLQAPSPNAHRWKPVATSRDLAIVRAHWREPIYPGVYSPMAVAVRTFGAGTRCSFSIDKTAVHHRVVIPGRVGPVVAPWTSLEVEMRRYAGFAQVAIQCDLEKLEEAPGDVSSADLTLFEFGGDRELAARYARARG